MARSKKYYKRKYKKYYRKKYYYSKRTSPRRSWRFANAPAGGYQIVRFRSSAAIPMSTDADGFSYVSWVHPGIYNYDHKTIAGEIFPVAMFQDEPAFQFFKFYEQMQIKGVKVKLTFPAPLATGKTAHLCYDWDRQWQWDDINHGSGLQRVNQRYLFNTSNQIQIASSARNTITLKCYPKGLERQAWIHTDVSSNSQTVLTNITFDMLDMEDFHMHKWTKPIFFWPCLKFGITNDQGGILSTFCQCELTTYVAFKDYNPYRAMTKVLPNPVNSAKTLSSTDLDTLPDRAAEPDPDDTLPVELDPDYQEALRQERLELASKKAKDKLLLERKLKRTD